MEKGVCVCVCKERERNRVCVWVGYATHTAKSLHVGCRFTQTKNDRFSICISFYMSDFHSKFFRRCAESSGRTNINTLAVDTSGNREECEGQIAGAPVADLLKTSRLMRQVFISVSSLWFLKIRTNLLQCSVLWVEKDFS